MATAEWWARYRDYLQSDQWKRKRRACLRRAGGVCERCARRVAKQAHHLTYKRLGKEAPGDLLAVCRPCHEALHDRKTAQQGERRGQ